jgi:hypothetical protein
MGASASASRALAGQSARSGLRAREDAADEDVDRPREPLIVGAGHDLVPCGVDAGILVRRSAVDRLGDGPSGAPGSEPWQGDQPAVVADPMKLEDFTNEPGADEPFTGLAAETEMGHVQLKVTDAELKAIEPCSSSPTGSAPTEENPSPRTPRTSSASTCCCPRRRTCAHWPSGSPRPTIPTHSRRTC